MVTICFTTMEGTHTHVHLHTHTPTLSAWKKQKWHLLLPSLGKSNSKNPIPTVNKMFPKGADRLTPGPCPPTSLFPRACLGEVGGKWAWTPGTETCLLSSPYSTTPFSSALGHGSGWEDKQLRPLLSPHTFGSAFQPSSA